MLVFARKLRKSANWSDWDAHAWMPPGHVPADPLNDLATQNNTLSVFDVGADEDRIKRVAAAMAAPCKNIQDFEYIVFDPALAQEVGAVVNQETGDTLDAGVNAWHYDIGQLSAMRLAELAGRLVRQADRDVIPAKSVVRLLARSVVEGHIPRDRVLAEGKSQRQLEEVLSSMQPPAEAGK